MPLNLVRVYVVGVTDSSWLGNVQLRGVAPFEAAGFDLFTREDDSDFAQMLIDFRPQVLISLGKVSQFPNLWAAPLEVRRRWVHIEDPATDLAVVAERIMGTFVLNATTERFHEEPLVSVFTPTYLSGEKIERPWCSLLAQSYPNWEWVIYDDSPDEGQTFGQMQNLCQQDARVSAFRGDRAIGNIGEVKRRACGLAKGAILIELDHDDALTPDALASVVEAYRVFPDAGFYYTDCAEVFEHGENATYGEGWAFGFGSYRQERLNGREYMVTNYPDINAKTIRHIVGAPNHLRAWTRAAYQASGGHSPELHVCDDYELLIRTFLTTRMVHIQRFGYIQYHNTASSGNTQRHRNAEIQRLVRYFRHHYNQRIHDRFIELGVDDFIWREGGALDWDAPHPAQVQFANYQLP